MSRGRGAREGGPTRILVAEPNRTLQTLIRLTLADPDLELVFCGDGRSALAEARARRPDVVICEARLPIVDGYALAEALRGDPDGGLSDVPFLMTMADWDRPDRERIAHLGVDGVLTKPFERAALLDRIRGVLGDARIGGGDARATRRSGHDEGAAAVGGSAGRVADDVEARSGALGAGRDGAETSDVASSEGSGLPAGGAGEASGGAGDERDGAAGAGVEALVEAAVARQLPAALERLMAERLEAWLEAAMADVVTPALAARMDDAIAEAMPQVLAAAGEGLGPASEDALRRAISEQVRPRTEEIVWKVVPELAEALIEAEIERLLADAPAPAADDTAQENPE